MKAMILAAGFGTRLFPLTIDRTKPAIPFLGKPLVGYVAEYVSRFGFEEVVVNLHHQPASVVAALGDGSRFNVKIHYTLEEPKILGTAGALDNARRLLEDDTFLIINGKIITDIDIAEAVRVHKKSGALATMVLMENKNFEKFTIVETDVDLVTGFGDFPAQIPGSELKMPELENEPIRCPLMFTGIHILEPRAFDYIPRGVYSDIVPTFYRPAIAQGEKIVAHITTGNWFELSTIPRYLDISLAMMNGRKNRVFYGERTIISDVAAAHDSVVWDDVTVEDGAQINRVIIADGVKVKSGENFENAAIVRADMLKNTDVPEKALKGYFAGENYIVPFTE